MLAIAAMAVGSLIVNVGEARPEPDRPADGGVTTASSPNGKTIEGFPEYVNGTRVLAAASASLPETTASLTFVPTTHDLVFISRCDSSDMWIYLTFPSGAESRPCGSPSEVPSEESLSSLGIKVGESVTVVFKADGVGRPSKGEAPASLPASGSMAVAVAEQVPFDKYPLPPKPATLPPLVTVPDADNTVRNTPGNPLAPRTVKVDWQQKLTFFAQMQTPGILRVLVNGREVTKCMKWDYSETSPKPSQTEINNQCVEEMILGDTDNPGKPGDHVDVTIEPQHVTGDWAVNITG